MLMLAAERWWGISGLLLAYGALCAWAWRRARRARQILPPAPATDWNVVYASQTGAAESLAHQAAQALSHHHSVRCLSLDQIDAASLQSGGRYLFIASTHGQGSAPDHAQTFLRHLLGSPLDLSRLEFGLLALGDRSYPAFCAFGRQLAGWLEGQGARSCFPHIEVDRLDPSALADWRQRLVDLLGASDLAASTSPADQPWQLLSRQHLNPGSQGGEVHHLRFIPIGHHPHWQSGDLALLSDPAGAERPREYSIASLPHEGCLDLLVRRSTRDDGSPGKVSGWLTGELPLGGEVRLTLREHRAFRLHDNLTRPAIFIGNGVGLAGLRGHLAARIAQGNHDNWLIFGERNARCDYHWQAELQHWQSSGALPHLQPVFSRDGGACLYVQDQLQIEHSRLLAWLERGAAIYVCGSRTGMGEAVDALLRRILGDAGLAELALSGRYCRDVF